MLMHLVAFVVLCALFNGGAASHEQKEGRDTGRRILRDLKEHWELAFGPKSDLFASSATLDLAIDDVAAGVERRASSLGPSRKKADVLFGNSRKDDEHISYARQLGCLPYSIGLELLRHQTEKAVSPALRAVPFVVNKGRNAICVHFTTIPAEFNEKFLFYYEIPVALTIDKRIYNVVDEMYFKNATMHQALGATPESRNVFLVVYPYRSNTSGSTSARIRYVVESLSKYPKVVFENFFWTSKNVSEHLRGLHSVQHSNRLDNPSRRLSGIEIDSQRHKTWSTLSAYLHKHLDHDDILSVNPSLPRELKATATQAASVMADPCQFERMIDDMHVYGDKITFPMDYLQAYQDERLAASCLAFLSSRLAMPTLVESGHKGSDVFHISLEYGPRLYNNRARSIPQSRTSATSMSSMPYTVAGIRGKGQVVGVADTGIDRSSCYFEDKVNGEVQAEPVPSKNFNLKYRKVVQYNFIEGQGNEGDTQSGHGTHVASTVAGSVDGEDDTYNGAAPDAKIAFMDMTSSGDGGLAVPDTADDLYAPSYAAGARLHSNSWGSNHDGRGYYTNSDSDGWLYENQDYVALYAAGNNGGQQNYLISQEAQGKNCFAVGAGESPSSIAAFSSVGPAFDNRIKPDLVLPGSGTISAEASGGAGGGDMWPFSCATGSKSGTSMATPAASGNAAVIRDYLANLWATICNQVVDTDKQVCMAMASPSGPMIKALMLHSGETMSNFGGSTALGDAPDSKQGYGIMFLGNVLPLPDASIIFGLYMDDATLDRAISSETTVRYNVVVISTDTPLRVTLSWYDPPNQNGISTAALLHDLDLMVTDPTGKAFWGNHRGEAGNKVDRLNNNEQVLISAPAVGTWKVTVTANALVQAETQAYAIVATFAKGGYATRDGEGGIEPPVPAPSPSPVTSAPTLSQNTAPPTTFGSPPPDGERTMSPTAGSTRDSTDAPTTGASDPPEFADDDHYHHKHPGNDDWHSHKRRSDEEDDYMPPRKSGAQSTQSHASEGDLASLSPFERRMIRAIRGVFAPRAQDAA